MKRLLFTGETALFRQGEQMQIAIISDIHRNLSALEAVLSDIDKSDPYAVINLGDCLSGPLQAAKAAELADSPDNARRAP